MSRKVGLPQECVGGEFDVQELPVLVLRHLVLDIIVSEFFTDANAHIVEDWLRFAVCKEDEVLEEAKNRLRGLKKYIS